MVGRVPLCVHRAGETKTGSLSTPETEEGKGLLSSYLGDFVQHLFALPKAIVQWESGGLDSREANSNEWEGSQSQGLGPTP